MPHARVRGAGVREMLEVAGRKRVKHRQREQRAPMNSSVPSMDGKLPTGRRPAKFGRTRTRITRTCRGAQGLQYPAVRMKAFRYLRDAAVFAPCYVLLDWVSYIHPLGPFNITPWNPQPALAIAWMLLGGLVTRRPCLRRSFSPTCWSGLFRGAMGWPP